MPLSNTKDTYLLAIMWLFTKIQFPSDYLNNQKNFWVFIFTFLSCFPPTFSKEIGIALDVLSVFLIFVIFSPLKTMKYFFFSDLLFVFLS